MQQSPSPSPSVPPVGFPEIPPTTIVDPHYGPDFDWSDFLDFNLDETVTISFPPPLQPQDQPPQQPDETGPISYTGRPRKRDPRLTCPNFLAGRVPCACPELDALLEEEEERAARGGPGTKRVRVSSGGPTRCQVPGCEVDISELKGYHKRHRVCLGCANAAFVVLDGEERRYCQQCGKFHLLSDFDEGKRSCRRKLERHNNRRRRKPQSSKAVAEKEAEKSILCDSDSGEEDDPKNDGSLRNQIEEREILSASENLEGPCVTSFAASGIHRNEKQNATYNSSTASYDEKKSTFSSVCPTGRISFKLYDWNPAEFPRRLRHQIFQWLANMPIELEGYIRPGCTILTAFIAMPTPMWAKLLEQPTSSIKELIASPGSLLAGRGSMLVYLNDMISRVPKDATSVVKLKAKNRAPKLHYIYPTCFEAGRPMEFVACGSDLLQPKFRCLISFSGSYMPYNIRVSCLNNKEANGSDHQLVKISIPRTDVDLYGPAFVEVENESGLSNFIPILISDREACTEMDLLLRNLDTKFFSPQEQPKPSSSYGCESFASRQARSSGFVQDVAWSLKKPVQQDSQLASSKVQNYNHLLKFLVENRSSVILKRVLCSLKSSSIADVSDADKRLLPKNMATAINTLELKSKEEETRDYIMIKEKSWLSSALVPLLNNEVVMNVDVKEEPLKPRHQLLTRTFANSRPLLVAIAALCVCFGVCAVALHPSRVGQIATTLRRCLFDEES